MYSIELLIRRPIHNRGFRLLLGAQRARSWPVTYVADNGTG
jgi:hypothetical protein